MNGTLDGRLENSAEHSWHAALLADVFKDYYPAELDINKVVFMLLLHDVGEIYAGDTFLYDEEGKADLFIRESNSFSKSLEMLPRGIKEKYTNLWIEFEKEQTHEASYARIIDAIVPLINHLVTAEENYNPSQLTKSQVIAKKKFIGEHAPVLWGFAEEVIDKSVKRGLYKNS